MLLFRPAPIWLALGLALPAQAEPAMFQASFILHAFGNDTSTGSASPYNTNTFAGVPLGRNCQDPSPYTSVSSLPAPHYCAQTTIHAGLPATGSGTLAFGDATVGGPVGLPANAFGHGAWLASGTPSVAPPGGFTTPIFARNGITGFLPIVYLVRQSTTYATFQNASGSFFASGGPAASGTLTRTGKAKRAGTWRITPGANALGGPMAILGRLGARSKHRIPGIPGTYLGATSWNMVKALGRTAPTAMGARIDPMNPYTNTGAFVNSVAGKTSTLSKLGTGSPWTTGDVTVYAIEGYFTTILRRSGHDTTSVSAMGAKVRNIQLVTPGLTHWQGPGVNDHTGHIGMLKLTIVPEPSALLLLASGAGALALLRCATRRG